MKKDEFSKKFLTTITCPECGGRMIVEVTRGNREDAFQASCFFCNECGRDTITFDDPDFEWKNDGIVLSPSQAASMPIGVGNVRRVFGYSDRDDFHSGDGEKILFRNGGTYAAFIWDKNRILSRLPLLLRNVATSSWMKCLDGQATTTISPLTVPHMKDTSLTG